MRIPWKMWVWPAAIVLSTMAAGLVTFVPPGTILRPALLMWFLFVCPGMTVVRFFRLSETAMEWTLAIALSFAIDAFIAGILLYAGWWSPPRILGTLIVFCDIGVMMQLVVFNSGSSVFMLKRKHIAPSKEQHDP